MITATIWYEELVNGSLIEHRETVTCDEFSWRDGVLTCANGTDGDPGHFDVHHVYAPGVWKRVVVIGSEQ